MNKRQRKRVIAAVFVFTSVIIAGTAGYIFIEGYSVLNALYMTVITLSTVGYGIPKPLDTSGQVFTIVLILFNLGVVGYTLTLVTSIFIQIDFAKHYRTRSMKKKINAMTRHVIVCGYGRTGRESCATLKRNKIPYVIIEDNEEMVREIMEDEDAFVIEMDATTDEALLAAGIKDASALITTLPDDAENVFVTLTASELNPSLFIVSRATHATSIPKLKRAGASDVIMPYKIGGAHMASLVINPDIKEFMDLIGGYGEFHPHIEEIDLMESGGIYEAKTLGEINLHKKTGINIIGIKVGDKYVINPDDETSYNKGDKLLVLGSPAQFERLKAFMTNTL
jgi:voltage-gated potassium channel